MYLPTTPIVTSCRGDLDAPHDPGPDVLGIGRRLQAEQLDHQVVQPLLLQHERQLVDRGLDVALLDHRLHRHVAEQAELVAQLGHERMVAAAHEDVRLDADLAQLGDALLRGLGLQFAGGAQVGHERHVDEHHLVRADLEGELAHGLEERQPLDVARRAADLGDEHVDAVAGLLDALLDLVGDVRDHLHGLAEVVAAALLLDHRLVDLARGEVVEPRQPARGEPLVVAEVEIGLRAVVEHVDLAVLERAHRARIDVEVGIELLDAHPQPAHLEQRAQRRRRQPLAQRGNHAARDKNVFHGIR